MPTTQWNAKWSWQTATVNWFEIHSDNTEWPLIWIEMDFCFHFSWTYAASTPLECRCACMYGCVREPPVECLRSVPFVYIIIIRCCRHFIEFCWLLINISVLFVSLASSLILFQLFVYAVRTFFVQQQHKMFATNVIFLLYLRHLFY